MTLSTKQKAESKKQKEGEKRKVAAASLRFLLFAFSVIQIALLYAPVQAQIVSEVEDESRLYAESKQVNQFFRRFNGEEDEKGNRYYSGDKQYRSEKLRKQYLRILFDESNTNIG